MTLMPIHGTMMETATPPKPIDIARVLVATRLMLPKTPLVLGYMRPKGKHKTETETDILAVKAGANAIAFPADQAIKRAKSMHIENVILINLLLPDLRRLETQCLKSVGILMTM